MLNKSKCKDVNHKIYNCLKSYLLDTLRFLSSIVYTAFFYKKDKFGIPVILYHRVLPKMPKYGGETILLKNFIKQMRYLDRKGYNTISLDDLSNWLNNRKELPKNPILLTFDDGHYSVYKYVYPILEKYGMKATIFLTSNFINGGKNPESIKNIYDSDFKTSQKVLEYIKKHPDHYLPLSWNNVHFLKSRGYSFGSHTMNHTDLNKLSGLQLAKELKSSKKKIELKINKNVFAFAYPFGEYNYRIVNLLKNKTDYKLAFTTDYGFVTKNTDKLKLNRIRIYSNNQFVFRARLEGFEGFEFITFVKKITKIINKLI